MFASRRTRETEACFFFFFSFYLREEIRSSVVNGYEWTLLFVNALLIIEIRFLQCFFLFFSSIKMSFRSIKKDWFPIRQTFDFTYILLANRRPCSRRDANDAREQWNTYKGTISTRSAFFEKNKCSFAFSHMHTSMYMYIYIYMYVYMYK